ncbi:MAG: ankyrin repeat domain-containing protein [Gemmataceae bacterium]|nr:ankyrin repeat domain-containing protein [Gemmataceae bacterium]
MGQSKATDEIAAFFAAAKRGDLAAVRACLRAGVAVDVRMPGKLTKEFEAARRTALMVAAEKGHRAVVALLLKAGADPNATDEYKTTALTGAVERNHRAVVALLLKAGADPNRRRHGGDFALRSAAVRGIDATITKLLLAHGADVRAHKNGGTALHIAAFHGRADVAKLLLKAGADPDGPHNGIGSPLSCAISHGQPKMVEFLLMHGVDPKRQPEALGIAAWEGKLQTVKKLLALGFDVNSRAFQGRTPLQHARNRKHRSVVEALRLAGATE